MSDPIDYQEWANFLAAYVEFNHDGSDIATRAWDAYLGIDHADEAPSWVPSPAKRANEAPSATRSDR